MGGGDVRGGWLSVEGEVRGGWGECEGGGEGERRVGGGGRGGRGVGVGTGGSGSGSPERRLDQEIGENRVLGRKERMRGTPCSFPRVGPPLPVCPFRLTHSIRMTFDPLSCS